MQCPHSQTPLKITRQENAPHAALLPAPHSPHKDDATPAHQHDDEALPVWQWIKERIARPHPALGREGPICPFVPAALQHKTLRLIMHPEINGQSKAALKETLAAYRKHILNATAGPAQEQGAFLLVFPHLHPRYGTVLEEATCELKETFVTARIMLGEFHPFSMAPGVHNPNFRPMYAPLPLVVLRRLSVHDILFLHKSKPLFEAYRSHFHHLYTSRRVAKNHGLIERYHEAITRFP